jgi:hypothetical protein
VETHQEYGITAQFYSKPLTDLELKETHLAPLANSFSRSTSTSTIKPDQASEETIPTPNNTTSSNNGIGRTCSPIRPTLPL